MWQMKYVPSSRSQWDTIQTFRFCIYSQPAVVQTHNPVPKLILQVDSTAGGTSWGTKEASGIFLIGMAMCVRAVEHYERVSTFQRL